MDLPWTLALASVGAAMAIMPNLVKTGTPSSPWLIVGLVVGWAAVVALIDHGRRRGEAGQDRHDMLRRAVVDGCISLDGRRLPRVRDVIDPTLLGVHRAALLQVTRSGSTALRRFSTIPDYIPRDIDTELRRLVAEGGFVLLIGDSAAGKSRASYEAIKATRPSDVLLVPRARNDVAAVAHA